MKAVGANWPQQKVPYTGDNEDGARSSERTRILKNSNPNPKFHTKLLKIGFSRNDSCSFCETQSETLSHIFYQCSHSRHFWTNS